MRHAEAVPATGRERGGAIAGGGPG